MTKILSASVFLLCISLIPQDAGAGTIIKFGLDSLSPNMSFGGTAELQTIDDGSLASGDQQSNVDFTGFLDAIQADTAVGQGASVSIHGISAAGGPQIVSLPGSGLNVILQRTLGGVFDFFAPEEVSHPGVYELLLSGVIGDGEIYGVEGNSVAHFRSSSPVVFTGGSLLPYLAPDSGSISISFTQVSQGLHLGPGNGTLADFNADATGNVTAEMVPEPATLLTFVLLGATGIRLRRRKLKTAQAVH